MLDQIYNENCLKTMKRMSDEFVDLVVTSPPYDDMRTYDADNLNSIFEFEKIAEELFRVIKIGGVLVWIVNDQSVDYDESGTSFRQALHFKQVGFKLFDTMIYKKKAMRMSSSLKHYLQMFEYMFVLSKDVPKTTNLIKDRRNKVISRKNDAKTHRQKDGSKKRKLVARSGEEFGRRTNIWEYMTGATHTTKNPVAYGHPAIFPEKLAYDHIVSWSNENDVVYDPFSGSGTTALMARQANRRFIASEINKDYFDLSLERVNEPMLDLRLS